MRALSLLSLLLVGCITVRQAAPPLQVPLLSYGRMPKEVIPNGVAGWPGRALRGLTLAALPAATSLSSITGVTLATAQTITGAKTLTATLLGTSATFSSTVTASGYAGSNTSATTLFTSPILAASASTTVAAFTFQASVDLDNTDLLFAFRDSAGTAVVRANEAGTMTTVTLTTGSINVTAQEITGTTNNAPLTFLSAITAAAGSASNSAFRLLPSNALDVGDRILIVGDNTGAVMLGVDFDGDVTVARTLQLGSIANASLPTCNAGAKGTQAYDSTNDKHVGCNGTAWTNMY